MTEEIAGIGSMVLRPVLKIKPSGAGITRLNKLSELMEQLELEADAFRLEFTADSSRPTPGHPEDKPKRLLSTKAQKRLAEVEKQITRLEFCLDDFRTTYKLGMSAPLARRLRGPAPEGPRGECTD